jgi:arsenate reductase
VNRRGPAFSGEVKAPVGKGSGKTRVLFVCVGNMIRSQMAEGFARRHGGAFIEVYSAGIRHTGHVSEDAIELMAEKGIDIGSQRSKGLGDVPLGEMDYIVNMSGYPNEAVFPNPLGATFVTWDVPDPLGGSMDRFRRARYDIEARVDQLLRRIWSEGSGKRKDRD